MKFMWNNESNCTTDSKLNLNIFIYQKKSLLLKEILIYSITSLVSNKIEYLRKSIIYWNKMEYLLFLIQNLFIKKRNV